MIKNPYIGIIGSMASGKTTFARELSAKTGYLLFEEQFEENPWLEKYYREPKSYALENEVWFIRKKADQHDEIAKSEIGCIQDSPIIMVPSFLDAMHKSDCIEFDDYIDCLQCYFTVVKTLKLPDILFRLCISEDLAFSRMRMRGRAMESELDVEYLKNCIDAVNLFNSEGLFTCQTGIPVIDLDASKSIQENIEVVMSHLNLEV